MPNKSLENAAQASKPAAGTLYIVSTPIGNSLDITQRAVKTLKIADIIVAEEGAVAARLLKEHHITKHIEELNEHNERTQTEALLKLLHEGKTLALVSDAGTPLLADPGGELARRALRAGISVQAAPGVSSVMTALVTSGLPMTEFLFAGFLSREPDERRQQLRRIAEEPRTVVLLETPYRLQPLLQVAFEIMPERRAYLGCNLTMPSETHHYGAIKDLHAKFSVNKFKGEFVLCFEGATLNESQAVSPREGESRPGQRFTGRPPGKPQGKRPSDRQRSDGQRSERGFSGQRSDGQRSERGFSGQRSDGQRSERGFSGQRSDGQRSERGFSGQRQDGRPPRRGAPGGARSDFRPPRRGGHSGGGGKTAR